ncbi:MAG: guanylate kinase [Alphaproteobacteria bacterium]|nr:guanylate kinase [Alphaproteobacteria bacterium]
MSDPAIARRGMMLVLSSPSGAGKTAISRELLDRDSNVTMSVSVTTRKKRPGEVAGRDYRFVDATEFNLMINRQELLEHAKVFGNYYGTPRAPVEQALSEGRDVIFDIDWQGAQQLKESARDDLVSVFILPPSHDELDRRLHTRAQDSEEVIAQRMAKASDEMSHWPEYDYIVVNRSLKESVAQVQAIVAAERLRRRRLIGMTEFVKRLQDGQ